MTTKFKVTSVATDKILRVTQRLTVEDERSASYPIATFIAAGGEAIIDTVAGSEVLIDEIDVVPEGATAAGAGGAA